MEKDQIPVGAAEDLTGQKYGELTVLYRVLNNGSTRGAKWRCQCSCGNITDVLAANLKRNHTLSCGCQQKQITSKNRFHDEVGNKYGRLTVLARGENYVSPSGSRQTTWKCQCDCGNIVTVHASSLRRGATLSCGCYRFEQISNRSNDQYLGQTFHYITVLARTDKQLASGERVWKCRCNLCNSECFISTGKLKTQISCGCLKDSYGVTIIKMLLYQSQLTFETEKTFDDCILSSGKKARFDFYVNNSYIIEFDGQQHYFASSSGWNTKEQLERTQKRDREKDAWCQRKKIPIIRIPYWAVENLSIADLQLNSQFLVQGVAEDEE